MTKILALSFVFFFGGLPARAAAPPEAMRFDAAASFQGLPVPKLPPLRRSLRAEQIKNKPGILNNDPRSGGRVIHLVGFLQLSGSSFVPMGSSFATITVSGGTPLSVDGQVVSAPIYLYDTSTYFLSGNFVSGFARPYTYVSVYENGKLLGTTLVGATIFVSGFYSPGGWVNLSGSGSVSGDLYVQEPAPQPNPPPGKP